MLAVLPYASCLVPYALSAACCLSACLPAACCLCPLPAAHCLLRATEPAVERAGVQRGRTMDQPWNPHPPNTSPQTHPHIPVELFARLFSREETVDKGIPPFKICDRMGPNTKIRRMFLHGYRISSECGVVVGPDQVLSKECA
jgi:hypothetical protein